MLLKNVFQCFRNPVLGLTKVASLVGSDFINSFAEVPKDDLAMAEEKKTMVIAKAATLSVVSWNLAETWMQSIDVGDPKVQRFPCLVEWVPVFPNEGYPLCSKNLSPVLGRHHDLISENQKVIA